MTDSLYSDRFTDKVLIINKNNSARPLMRTLSNFGKVQIISIHDGIPANLPKKQSMCFIDIGEDFFEIKTTLNNLRMLIPNTKLCVILGAFDFDLFYSLVLENQNYFLNKDSKNLGQDIANLYYASKNEIIFPSGYEIFITKCLKELEKRRNHDEGTIIHSQILHLNLTPKEQDVFSMLSKGLSYIEAAESLNMKIDTFRYYLKKLYKKLGAHNKVQALTCSNTQDPKIKERVKNSL